MASATAIPGSTIPSAPSMSLSDTVPASGSFKIGGLEAGNCEVTLVSRIHALADDGWEVTLVALHAAPFCDGAAVDGSFAACLIPEPF